MYPDGLRIAVDRRASSRRRMRLDFFLEVGIACCTPMYWMDAACLRWNPVFLEMGSGALAAQLRDRE